MYHTLGDDAQQLDAWTVVRMRDFKAQMSILRQHYDIVSLDHAVDALQSRARPARPLVVLTFDDGHTGLHSHLLPYVARERLPVTVYVATGHVQSGQPYWFDRAMNALQCNRPVALDLRAHGLGQPVVGATHGAANWEAIDALLGAMKQLSVPQREAACHAIEQQMRGHHPDDSAPLAPLTLSQLKELAASPWVTIGAHTHGHDLLDQLPASEARQTIETSRTLLQEWTGQPVTHFAYPNGNFTPALVQMVTRMGFATACTTQHQLWLDGHRTHEIGRVPVGRYDTLSRFKWALLKGWGATQGAQARPTAAEAATSV